MTDLANGKRRKPRQAAKPHAAVPNFLLKVYEILENPEYESIICWSEDGEAFIVKNITAFSDHILPKYFKHNNFASFIRQLNMYDFHKLKHDTNENEFRHTMFKRDHKHLLKDIKRKKVEHHHTPHNQLVPVGKEIDMEKVKKEATHFTGELKTMKNKQNDLEKMTKTVYNQNNQLIEENKMLWNELTKNKDKYEKKIEKLMMFIVSLAQHTGDQKAIASSLNMKSLTDKDFDEKDFLPIQQQLEFKPETTSVHRSTTKRYPEQYENFNYTPELSLNNSQRKMNETPIAKMSRAQKEEEIRNGFKDQMLTSTRKNSNLNQQQSLAFKPFNLNSPLKRTGTYKANKKETRNLPFDNLEEDLEPVLQKQIKTRIDVKPNEQQMLLMRNINNNEKAIDQISIEPLDRPQGQPFLLGLSRSTSLTFPEMDVSQPMMNMGNQFGNANFLEERPNIVPEFKKEDFSSFYGNDDKNAFIFRTKEEPMLEGFGALPPANNNAFWMNFPNNNAFFSFEKMPEDN